jgi:hypothetical protein
MRRFIRRLAGGRSASPAAPASDRAGVLQVLRPTSNRLTVSYRASRTVSPAPPVTPDQFIAKWKTAELKERAAAHSHFIDLCRLLDEPAPTDADPTGRMVRHQNHRRDQAFDEMPDTFVTL